ncbi:hypothetical protein [Planomonospora venezuelensis]|uniref:Uncharacterized protein n=1 Tax=Planomonospora venezuelensis TaxID=1999 RepID=A0A841DCN6_PLAVE|nr:hypothetical protein [Planomonospora venezuelensis]MBB5966204.1 hypothetical protein [Planomonospora venezuelensis]GIN05179.1 hypothetical protein Pve01_68370 [Planomonospora venezuelensis]
MDNQGGSDPAPKDAFGWEVERMAGTASWIVLFSLSILVTLAGFLINVYDYSWNTGEPMGVDRDALIVARFIFYIAISLNMISMVVANATSKRILSLVLGFAAIARLVFLPE